MTPDTVALNRILSVVLFGNLQVPNQRPNFVDKRRDNDGKSFKNLTNAASISMYGTHARTHTHTHLRLDAH